MAAYSRFVRALVSVVAVQPGDSAEAMAADRAGSNPRVSASAMSRSGSRVKSTELVGLGDRRWRVGHEARPTRTYGAEFPAGRLPYASSALRGRPGDALSEIELLAE